MNNWASQKTLVVKNQPVNAGEIKDIRERCGFNLLVREIYWRRAWQPALVFLPGKPHGQKSLAVYGTQGRK